MENKVTKRDFYNAIIALADANGGEINGIAAEEIKTFAAKEIELLDKKAAKAKERAATKRAEGDELTDAVRAALSADTFEPIADIAARIEGEDVTISKVTYRLTQLVKNGEAEKQEITVPGVDGGKARKIQGYKALNA